MTNYGQTLLGSTAILTRYLHHIMIPRVLTRVVLFGLAATVWSHVEIESEDYFFPLEPVINFCKMSDQCKHDFVTICGKDTLGITRLFNDNCDMYEYNCDEKKQFRHVNYGHCDFKIKANERIGDVYEPSEDE